MKMTTSTERIYIKNVSVSVERTIVQNNLKVIISPDHTYDINILNCDVNDNSGVDRKMNDSEMKSEIQRFYDGKNILITGSTGFLGKVLVEKLLRCCSGVGNLYLLIRQKRGKDINTRVEEIFEDPLFIRLKEEVPKFRHKLVAVSADCKASGLGLSLTDRQMLIDKVNMIFHCAATVKFDEHLREALATNVSALLHLLKLARDMKGLDVMMQVSTAYSNSHLKLIEEKFYPCNADCEMLKTVVDKLTDTQIDDILPKILGPWPNTYTFTKALAEKALRNNSSGIAIGIFRPAIVTSTLKEPLKCWVDNMNGPTGVSVGGATGMLRVLNCNESVTAEIVPVDYVVNCLIASAVSVANSYKQNPPSEPPIYNYVSSVENSITWGVFVAQNIARIDKHPFSNAVWYTCLKLTPNYFIYSFYMIFLHLIPAALVDVLTLCIGKKPKMLKVYSKIHKSAYAIRYFCTQEIQFCNRRTRQLWEDTSELDKKLFPFSMREVDWNEYFEEYLLGIRRHLFKETDATLPQAKLKLKRLYYLHRVVSISFYIFITYAIWSIFTILF